MNYPSVGQYTETIKMAAKAPKDYFDKLSNLWPVLDVHGEPVMSSGNFAVVYKMYNPKNNKHYALKCFHREQKGREQHYKMISEELNRELSRHSYGTYNISSSYLLHVEYYEKELFVDIGGPITLFPVLLMEWVDGITLDRCILQNLNNTKLLHELAYRFSRMAKWLLSQRFAHGDLKPDNILITKDYSIVLVDYDGMYVPSMKGQKAIELGSPNFRNPHRTIDDFDEQIDDFPIVNILLSLKAVSLKPDIFSPYITGDKMLFGESDYLSLQNSNILSLLNQVLYDKEIVALLGTFLIMLYSYDFPNSISGVIDIRQSIETESKKYSVKQAKEKIELFFKSISLYPFKIVYLLPDLFNIDEFRNLWLPKQLWYKFSVSSGWSDESVYSSIYRWSVEYDSIQYSVRGEFSKKSRPDLVKMHEAVFGNKLDYIVDYTYEILFELGVVDFFADKSFDLIKIVNKNNSYTLQKKQNEAKDKRNNPKNDDLPF